jgi:hypothetical protein
MTTITRLGSLAGVRDAPLTKALDAELEKLSMGRLPLADRDNAKLAQPASVRRLPNANGDAGSSK